MRPLHPHPRPRLQRLPGDHRLGLPLRGDRLRFAVVDRLPGRPLSLLADEHPVDRRRRLQARPGVDDVAGGHPLAGLRASSEPHERLAGVDADPHLELVALARPVADRERGADSALGVVLVRGRRAEDGHHRIADELLDGAAVALELAADAGVVAAELGLDVLGVHPLGARG